MRRVHTTVENPVGTAASVQCGVDAWPADINNDGFSDIFDIVRLTNDFALSVPPAPPRHNIAPDPPDTFVDIFDISRLTAFFGLGCGAINSYGYYHPVTPARIVDTRVGLGWPGKLGHNGTATVHVAGSGGVPSAGVTAIVVNVTVTEPTANGYLTIYKSGENQPATSNVNFAAGQTVANLVTVGVGADGNIKIYNAVGQTHVILDVAGWYGAPNGGSRYNTVTPRRILDTRNATGGVTKIGPNGSITVDVTDTYGSGVPASGVTAVAVHAAVAEPTAQSYLTVYPSEAPKPSVANLNFPAGQTVSNLIVVKVGVGAGADGNLNVYNAAGSTHVIFDVVGWYGPESGDVFNLVSPSRVLHTGNGPPFPAPGPLGPGAEMTVDVTGVGSLPPSGSSSVVVNVAVTEPTAPSYLTVYPSLSPRPDTSSLNFAAQQTVANLDVVKVGADGNVKVFNSAGQTHVIFDAAGYFGPEDGAPEGGTPEEGAPEGESPEGGAPESSSSPRLSLDMETTGNSYNDATNSVTLGPVDSCLTSMPGNNAAHNHVAHVVIQDVEDLIGWQARLNYDGGKMRPLSVNYTPFTDSTLGQNISFLNLPMDPAAGVHRDITSANSIPPPAAGPQTALIGATYLGTQNAAVSADTPPKVPPDDTSYSAPSGGVLAALTLRVEAGQAGQASLSMDVDDGNPKAPGSGVVVFTDTGTVTIELGEEALGDGSHAEGASCPGVAAFPPARYAAAPGRRA